MSPFFPLSPFFPPPSPFFPPDIWAGVLAKKVLDHLGWRISAGEPAITQMRASDPMVNLVKEAPGVAANESFWEAVDSARLNSDSPSGCMGELGEHLSS